MCVSGAAAYTSTAAAALSIPLHDAISLKCWYTYNIIHMHGVPEPVETPFLIAVEITAEFDRPYCKDECYISQ